MVRRRRQIHVWWGGLQRNGDILLLLAYLLSLNPGWRDAQVSIPSLATTETMRARTTDFLRRMLDVVHNASLFTGGLLDGGEFEDLEEVVRPALRADKSPGHREDETHASKPAGE